jgi:monofunctional biosynthetic peptidoglycan transglycosylase
MASAATAIKESKLRPFSCLDATELNLLRKESHLALPDYAAEYTTLKPCPKGVVIRIFKPLNQIASSLIDTVVFLEDAKFWQHKGIDASELMNAIEEDIKSGSLKRGGSTITQQLAKNLYLSKEKSFARKLREFDYAMRLEKNLTKKEILQLYLNLIEWGPGIFGVEAAARTYFDKSAKDLTEVESWLLALMIPNPKELCLWFRPKAIKSLRNRLDSLTQRLVSEKKSSASAVALKKDEFLRFIDQWRSTKPAHTGPHSERRYPAYWSQKFK